MRNENFTATSLYNFPSFSPSPSPSPPTPPSPPSSISAGATFLSITLGSNASKFDGLVKKGSWM